MRAYGWALVCPHPRLVVRNDNNDDNNNNKNNTIYNNIIIIIINNNNNNNMTMATNHHAHQQTEPRYLPAELLRVLRKQAQLCDNRHQSRGRRRVLQQASGACVRGRAGACACN